MTVDSVSLEDARLLPLFAKRPLTIVRGEGAWLYDSDGNRYLDCMGGHGVCAVGHSHPTITKAIADQSAKLTICPSSVYNDARAIFLEKLFSVCPPGLSRAFLCNSGTEAIEAALKFARFSTGRNEIISCMRGYHGRTMGALSATHNPKHRAGVGPLDDSVMHIPCSLEKLQSTVSSSTAAVLIELIQGEGGVHVIDTEFVHAARSLCDKHGAVLIIDEIQTGFGRTGRMFACEHYDVSPDILCLAKAMGGGIPMGGVLCSGAISIRPGLHGSTFGGNPLACAAGTAVLTVLEEEKLISYASAIGEYFIEQLRGLSSTRIVEVRGMGLMIGVVLKEKVQPLLHQLLQHGILALPAGATVLRFLPPLCVTREDVDVIVSVLDKLL